MGLDQKLVITKRETAAIFRKENHLRQWFINHDIVDNEDNCVYRSITQEQLIELINDIKAVLEDHSKAEDLLPLCDGGFFFGKYADDENAYDEWYFKDLQEELETLTEILEKVDWDNEYLEYYDWW